MIKKKKEKEISIIEASHLTFSEYLSSSHLFTTRYVFWNHLLFK